VCLDNYRGRDGSPHNNQKGRSMTRQHRCDKDGRGSHGEGTNACYTLCRCRCYRCAGAGTAYRRKLEQEGPQTVDAEPVREHVRSLMAPKVGSHSGVGLKQIVKVSGVSQGALWKLMYGDPNRGGPSSKVRKTTADRLLAVTRKDAADGADVAAFQTWRKVNQLLDAGFCKAELGRYLTGNPTAKSLQLNRKRVSVANARKVDSLWRRWKAGDIVPRGKTPRHYYGPPSPFPATPAPSEWVRATCESCGAPPLAGGRWCLPCFKSNATPDTRGPSIPDRRCGTRAGYHAHLRRNEHPCERCKASRRESAA
jgi:hypothetical protein